MSFLKKIVLFNSVILCLTLQLLAQSNSYQREIDQWHKKRIENLKTENGWLTLVGLYWLHEGANSFGSGKNNKIIFPDGTIASTAGTFERTGNKIKLKVTPGVIILIDGKSVHEAVIFDADSGREPVVSSGNLKWVIIKRDSKIGVRLRNIKSPALTAFKGVDCFKVDTFWRIPAHLQRPEKVSTVPITNIIGQTTQENAAGKLVFQIDGKKYSLIALQMEKELFIIFADSTSGVTTYPTGRFLHVKDPGPDGNTYIDFNKSYNPPCAFTPYATCPLPPKENRLTVRVTAGEKYKTSKL
jgi:uncharacterized protein